MSYRIVLEWSRNAEMSIDPVAQNLEAIWKLTLPICQGAHG